MRTNMLLQSEQDGSEIERLSELLYNREGADITRLQDALDQTDDRGSARVDGRGPDELQRLQQSQGGAKRNTKLEI